MEKDYMNMSAAELEALLKQTQEKIEDIEDEQDIILEQSQSGQHTGSKKIQSKIQSLDAERTALQAAVKEITEALQNKAFLEDLCATTLSTRHL